MKKHAIIGILVIILILGVPAFTYATLTASFGGKVITTTVPDVTCTGSGTGPVVLLSSLLHLTSAVVVSTPAVKTTVPVRVGGVVSGLFGAIPFYTQSTSSSSTSGSTPQPDSWILGRANVIPDFSTCYLQLGPYRLPFPVRDTSNYKTSSNTGNSSF
jgi:hypothetical protein